MEETAEVSSDESQHDDMEAEPDSDQEQDIDQMLGSWLGELENMTKQMDSGIINIPMPASPFPQPSVNNLDNFRFSQCYLETQISVGASSEGANISALSAIEEDEQDVDLDALLGDLCAMEQNLQEQMASSLAISAAQESVKPIPPTFRDIPPPPPPPASGTEILYSIEDLPPPPPMAEEEYSLANSIPIPPPAPPLPEENVAVNLGSPSSPPVNHSVSPPPPPSFQRSRKPPSLTLSTESDSVTSPISASSPSSVASQPSISVTASSPSPILSPNSRNPTLIQSPTSPNLSKSVRVKLKDLEKQLENDTTLTEEEKQAKLKSEKIKIALQKLKAAKVQKLVIRVYTDDGSSKTVFVEETMTCRMVSHMMVEKNHLEEKPDWVLIEQMPDLYIERTLEDHENIVNDVLMNWKRDTTNRLLFSERKDKYAILRNPQHFLLSAHSSQKATEFAEKSKEVLIKEFFSGTGSQVPEVEGPLWLKMEGKKSWKKFFFILRASGLYYSPKGKSKSSKDLTCISNFEHNDIYHGVNWKKKYKAPTDHCFALKHPQLQQKSKYIKYLCAEDYRSCQRWMAGIRIAKLGMKIYENYQQTQKEMAEYVLQMGESMSQSSSMTDTASVSSMHSSVSSHSSHSASSQGGGPVITHSNPAANTLSQGNNTPSRRNTVGNLFANAWKKGLEAETGNKNISPLARSTTAVPRRMHNISPLARSTTAVPRQMHNVGNGSIMHSPPGLDLEELQEAPRTAIVTPTKSKRPSETYDEFEVQKALLELETDLSNQDLNQQGAYDD